MANDFKRFAKPSVGTSTGASPDAVYTVRQVWINSVRINRYRNYFTNKTSTGVTASVFLDNEDGSNDVFIVKDSPISFFIRDNVRK